MSVMRHGIHPELEEVANQLIKESLVGVTKYSEKSDILTPWKENMRRKREVLTASGTPDSSIRKGMYHRKLNTSRPELNSRDGISQARSTSIGGTLSGFVLENGPSPREFNV